MKHSMTKLPWGLAMVLNLLLMSAAIGCSASTSALPVASLSGWNPASPAEDGQFEQQSAEDLPVIHHASVQPTKVFPGDTMVVTAEVSDSSGIKRVTADMGGIETISLSLIEGSIYHGTWSGQWLVHDTTVRDYVTTIVAINSIGKSSATDVLWRDAVTYERYHKEVYGTANTSSTTMQTALTLTFSPNVDGDFMILGRANIGQTVDTSDQTEAEILCYITGTATGGSATTLVDTALDEADGYYVGWILEMTSGVNIGEFQTVTAFVQSTNTLTTATFDQANSAGDTYKLYRVINSILFYPNATDEAAAFGAHDILSLDNAKTYNFSINYRSVNGTNLATIKNYGINAMAIAGYGGFTAHSDDDAGTSGSPTAWQTIVTASISGTAGDYLVIGSMEMQLNDTGKTMNFRILEDDTTGWGEISRDPTNVAQWHMFQDMRRVTVDSGAHNFKLQWDCDGGSTATVRRAHIAAVNIATLSDTTSEYTEEEAEESTTSTTWVVKMFHQFTPGTCWNGLRIGYGMMSSKDKTDYVYVGIDEDGVEIGTTNMKPNNQTSDYMPFWTALHRFHAPSQWTIDVKYKAASGGTAYSKNDRVLIIRLDNLNPFGDLGHTGYLDTFDEAAEDTVYIQGCYYYNVIPYDAVTVTYYDGNNDIVASDSTADADVNGVIESQLYFPNYAGSAEPGTWHAVSTVDAILTAYSQTIPSTYSANWIYSVRECEFTVTAAAIPEFPTIMAAIMVVGLCFGIYYWMRRRRLAYVKA